MKKSRLLFITPLMCSIFAFSAFSYNGHKEVRAEDLEPTTEVDANINISGARFFSENQIGLTREFFVDCYEFHCLTEDLSIEFTVSDNEVIDLTTNLPATDYGFYFELSTKKLGTANITVTVRGNDKEASKTIEIVCDQFLHLEDLEHGVNYHPYLVDETRVAFFINGGLLNYDLTVDHSLAEEESSGYFYDNDTHFFTVEGVRGNYYLKNYLGQYVYADNDVVILGSKEDSQPWINFSRYWTTQDNKIVYVDINSEQLTVTSGNPHLAFTFNTLIYINPNEDYTVDHFEVTSLQLEANSFTKMWQTTNNMYIQPVFKSGKIGGFYNSTSLIVSMSDWKAIYETDWSGELIVTLTETLTGFSSEVIATGTYVEYPVVAIEDLKDYFNQTVITYGVFSGEVKTSDGGYDKFDTRSFYLADGNHSIYVYKATDRYFPTLVVNETIVVACGTVANYNGLPELTYSKYEIVSSSPIPLNTSIHPMYVSGGSFSSDDLSREVVIRGYVSSINKTRDSWSSESSVTLNMRLDSGEDVQVYINKLSSVPSISEEEFNELKEPLFSSYESSGSIKITLRGYLSVYKTTYQIVFPTLYKGLTNNNALGFAKEFLDQSEEVCSSETAHLNKLNNIWSIFEENYNALSDEEKALLVNADASETDNDISKAMERYDYIVSKYNLNHFITGRSISLNGQLNFNNESDTSSLIIIVSALAISLLSLSVLIVLKKKKAR